MQILLLADIHGNYPALQAIDDYFSDAVFDAVINCGDSVVYAPFPNEVLTWLMQKRAISILGNTDKKVIRILSGKSFKKPSKPEKRIMYTHTAKLLTASCCEYLLSFPISSEFSLESTDTEKKYPANCIGIFHGSPAKPHEFLFDSTPKDRFVQLADTYPYRVIVTGHSHTPYHFPIGSTHFINPGSVGRMFDNNPAVSCAVLQINNACLKVKHHRIRYDISQVTEKLQACQLPPIYQLMYILGKKLN